MNDLIVPTKLEEYLVLSDGSQGANTMQVLSFKHDQVENLYNWDPSKKEFKLSFQERGVAYHETDSTQQLAKITLTNLTGNVNFQLMFDPTPIVKWGINWVGVVSVKHTPGATTRCIYIPGTRTYDPAGKSGDPHASERIGPSCSRTQIGITIAQLSAVVCGATRGQLEELQDVLRPLIIRYHGRVPLFDWMCLQICQTVFENKDVTPYPEYLKGLLRSNKLQLDATRDHTRSYLTSYNQNKPHPPIQYYKKVATKDKINEIFSVQDLAKFQALIQ